MEPVFDQTTSRVWKSLGLKAEESALVHLSLSLALSLSLSNLLSPHPLLILETIDAPDQLNDRRKNAFWKY